MLSRQKYRASLLKATVGGHYMMGRFLSYVVKTQEEELTPLRDGVFSVPWPVLRAHGRGNLMF